MKKYIFLIHLFGVILSFFIFGITTTTINAQTSKCGDLSFSNEDNSTPSPFSREFKGKVTLKTTQDCFNSNAPYTFFAYKKSDGFKDVGTTTKVSGTVKDTKTIFVNNFRLPIGLTSGTGTLVICTVQQGSENDVSRCNSPQKPDFIGSIDFEVEQRGGLQPDISSIPSDGIIQIGDTPRALLSNIKQGEKYGIWWDGDRRQVQIEEGQQSPSRIINIQSGDDADNFKKSGKKKLCMMVNPSAGIPIAGTIGLSCQKSIIYDFRSTPVAKTNECIIGPSNPKPKDTITVTATNIKTNTAYIMILEGQELSTQNSNQSTDITFSLGDTLKEQTYTVAIKQEDTADPVCTKQFVISSNPQIGVGGNNLTSCTPGTPNCSTASGISCDPDNPKNPNGSINPGPGVLTAIGCIPTNPIALIQGILKVSLAAAGGIALLLTSFGAIQMITSHGDPQALKKGQDQFSSAIIGLLFIIFSVLLLRIIGVDILNIPGFS